MLMIKRFGIKLLEMVYPFKVLNNLMDGITITMKDLTKKMVNL